MTTNIKLIQANTDRETEIKSEGLHTLEDLKHFLANENGYCYEHIKFINYKGYIKEEQYKFVTNTLNDNIMKAYPKAKVSYIVENTEI